MDIPELHDVPEENPHEPGFNATVPLTGETVDTWRDGWIEGVRYGTVWCFSRRSPFSQKPETVRPPLCQTPAELAATHR